MSKKVLSEVEEAVHVEKLQWSNVLEELSDGWKYRFMCEERDTYSTVGTAIVCIRNLKNKLKNQEKEIKRLRLEIRQVSQITLDEMIEVYRTAREGKS